MRGQSNNSNIGSGRSNERPLVAESGHSKLPKKIGLNVRFTPKADVNLAHFDANQ
jgi:hypothetical protein